MSKNSDNFDTVEKLQFNLDTIQNNILTTSEERNTDGNETLIVKEIESNVLSQLEIFVLIFDDETENIYKSHLVIRKRTAELEFLTSTNLRTVVEANDNWTLTFRNSSNNLGININTNGDPVKIKVLFNEYRVQT